MSGVWPQTPGLSELGGPLAVPAPSDGGHSAVGNGGHPSLPGHTFCAKTCFPRETETSQPRLGGRDGSQHQAGEEASRETPGDATSESGCLMTIPPTAS